MKIINAHVFLDGVFQDISVSFNDRIITALDDPFEDEIIDGKGCFLYAGIIDPHCHGAYLRSFRRDPGYTSMGTHQQQIRDLLALLPQSGVTSVFPTLSGDDFEAIRESIITMRNMKDSCRGAEILKYHLEGTYVTLDRYVYPGRPGPDTKHTDWLVSDRYDDIALISAAPEAEGALPWIDYVVSKGVMPELCHSKATADEVRIAADHGMLMADHLFNGLPVMHHRISGPNEGVLLDDRIRIQINTDGYHVNPVWVRLAIRVKGLKNCIGITDLQACAGLSDGIHQLDDGSILEVRDGFGYRPDGHIKGGNSVMNEMMRRARDVCGLTMEEVGSLFAENTAEILGIKDRGKIERGRKSDLVLMDRDYNVLLTIINGRVFYRNPAYDLY